MVKKPKKTGKPVSAPTPAAEPTQIDGGLVAITGAGIAGWAWDLSAPLSAVAVEIWADDSKLAEGLADDLSPALADLHGRKGIPGFVLQLDQLPRRYPSQLTLRVAGGAPLGPPLVVAAAGVLDPLLKMPFSDHYQGYLEGIVDGVLSGWAWDKTRPGDPIAVELLDGGIRLDAVEADIYREDLHSAGVGDGRHAFQFALSSALLDGNQHLLRVRVVGTSTIIHSTPILFGPQNASGIHEEIAALRGDVARLTKLVNGIMAPDGRVQREIISIFADRIAAVAEVQREMVERELDALRKLAFSSPGRATPR